MAKRKGKHTSDTAAYTRYKANNSFEKNKVKKLEKIIKEQPNNEAIIKVLENYIKNGVPYTRNRRPQKPGEFKNRYPTLKLDIDKHKKYERKKLEKTRDPWKEVLLSGWR